MRGASWGLLSLSLCWGAAQAQEMKVLPLAPPSALLTEDRQAATIEKFGQVSIAEISLASKIGITDSAIAEVKPHEQRFDFYLVSPHNLTTQHGYAQHHSCRYDDCVY